MNRLSSAMSGAGEATTILRNGRAQHYSRATETVKMQTKKALMTRTSREVGTGTFVLASVVEKVEPIFEAGSRVLFLLFVLVIIATSD